jgi:hypothetical protein
MAEESSVIYILALRKEGHAKESPERAGIELTV